MLAVHLLLSLTGGLMFISSTSGYRTRRICTISFKWICIYLIDLQMSVIPVKLLSWIIACHDIILSTILLEIFIFGFADSVRAPSLIHTRVFYVCSHIKPPVLWQTTARWLARSYMISFYFQCKRRAEWWSGIPNLCGSVRTRIFNHFNIWQCHSSDSHPQFVLHSGSVLENKLLFLYNNLASGSFLPLFLNNGFLSSVTVVFSLFPFPTPPLVRWYPFEYFWDCCKHLPGNPGPVVSATRSVRESPPPSPAYQTSKITHFPQIRLQEKVSIH